MISVYLLLDLTDIDLPMESVGTVALELAEATDDLQASGEVLVFGL